MALYFFPSFSLSLSLTKYLAFNIFSMYFIYTEWYMSSVSFVSCVILLYLLLSLTYL